MGIVPQCTICDGVFLALEISVAGTVLTKKMLFVLNNTDRYCLDALLELAGCFPDSLPAAEIARRRTIPAAYLSRLLRQLARDGIVTARRGPGGGIGLATHPAEISVRRILDRDCTVRPSPPPLDRLEEIVERAVSRALENLSVADLERWERDQHTTLNYVI